MKIQPARRIRGGLRLPGDKSISHRAALLAALADGQTLITNFSTSADCASTLRCLRQMRVSIERQGTSVRIDGVGARGLRASSSVLDCGNSGSTMRLLAGVLAGQDFVSHLTGDESLRARPMKRIIEPLELMGARIISTEGKAPLQIAGRWPLRPIRYEMAIASAQVKSCVLLAALNASGRTQVIEEAGATRDHTERMLRWFGVAIESDITEQAGIMKSRLTIDGLTRFSARDVSIPGDISSAAFFIVAAALLPGSELEIEEVGLNPTRAQILSTLQTLGAPIRATNLRQQCEEAIGDIQVSGGLSNVSGEGAIVLRGRVISRLIDELPVLAIMATQLSGGMEIRGAAELRFKESDRIGATVENLRAMGAQVEEFDDGMRVHECTRLRGARIRTHGDHRIAMAFTIAALLAEGESELDDAECVNISFPEFFELLESVIER